MLLRYVDDIFDTESSTATIGVDFRVSLLFFCYSVVWIGRGEGKGGVRGGGVQRIIITAHPPAAA